MNGADARQRLSVGMLTWNSGARLHAAIRAARVYADQIVVGVDDMSDPLTYDLACRLADVVFRFEHAPVIDGAYMHCFRYATSDWLLMLADDERLGMEYDRFRSLASILDDTGYTHHFLPTQFIISLDPIAYINAAPYYPDYHVRLMRNDATLVTQRPAWHTGISIAGGGSYLPYFPIRHYERVMRTGPERAFKVERSRQIGWPSSMEAVYLGGDDLPRIQLPWTAHPEYQLLGEVSRGAEVISGLLSADGSAHD